MPKQSHYRDLLKEMEELQKKIDAVRTLERETAINQCLALITDYELTSFDLGFSKVQKIKSAKVKTSERTFTVKSPKSINPPKYQDPATGATWTGRGKAPGWMTGPREDYLLDMPQSTVTHIDGRMRAAA